jgi:hypothetical protein
MAAQAAIHVSFSDRFWQSESLNLWAPPVLHLGKPGLAWMAACAAMTASVNFERPATLPA